MVATATLTGLGSIDHCASVVWVYLTLAVRRLAFGFAGCGSCTLTHCELGAGLTYTSPGWKGRYLACPLILCSVTNPLTCFGKASG
jgi:hypothetical protein